MMREVPITRRLRDTKREGTARTRARATHWGYNPRDAFSVRKCWQALQVQPTEATCTISGGKDRNFLSTLDYDRLQVFNVANIKSHAYWRMNDLIGNVILKRVFAQFYTCISYFDGSVDISLRIFKHFPISKFNPKNDQEFYFVLNRI